MDFVKLLKEAVERNDDIFFKDILNELEEVANKRTEYRNPYENRPKRKLQEYLEKKFWKDIENRDNSKTLNEKFIKHGTLNGKLLEYDIGTEKIIVNKSTVKNIADLATLSK